MEILEIWEGNILGGVWVELLGVGLGFGVYGLFCLKEDLEVKFDELKVDVLNLGDEFQLNPREVTSVKLTGRFNHKLRRESILKNYLSRRNIKMLGKEFEKAKIKALAYDHETKNRNGIKNNENLNLNAGNSNASKSVRVQTNSQQKGSEGSDLETELGMTNLIFKQKLSELHTQCSKLQKERNQILELNKRFRRKIKSIEESGKEYENLWKDEKSKGKEALTKINNQKEMINGATSKLKKQDQKTTRKG